TPELLTLLIDMCSAMKTYANMLKSLQQNSCFYHRLKIFVNDLLIFGKDLEAQERLEFEPVATLYVSSVYFTAQEIIYLLKFPSGTGLTLQQTLEVTLSDKTTAAQSGRSRDFQVCTSHDLAPVIHSLQSFQKGLEEERKQLETEMIMGRGRCSLLNTRAHSVRLDFLSSSSPS
ncbi:hypothetical protein HKX48_007718, partial [Thoreauomyces humboldtii]